MSSQSHFFPMSNHTQQPSTSSQSTVVPQGPASDSGCSPGSLSKGAQTGRTLVLCFDGTGDKFDADNSNIVQFCSMLKKDDQTKQLVYYHTGIGTYTAPQLSMVPLVSKVSKLLDDMFAWNIPTHIMDGYKFLMQYYTPGDRICLFGFSRGAYTARCLAGMLHKVGLLSPGNEQHVPFAYKMYVGQKGRTQSKEFKRAFAADVKIDFVGVWDTVSSVGVIPKRLPFAKSNTIIRTFRHAVSLDERRAWFKANHWNRPDADERKPGTEARKKNKRGSFMKGDGCEDESGSEGSVDDETDVAEVWFAGCHCDIGGGSICNSVPHKLSRIPLRWMIRECFKTKSGILFDRARMEELGLNPDTITDRRPHALSGASMTLKKRKHWWSKLLLPLQRRPAVHEDAHAREGGPVQGTEEEAEELRDAMMPKYDQLHEVWAWWLLEVVPMTHVYQRRDGRWDWWFGMNLGRGRRIEEPAGARVHRSVRTRMEAAFCDGRRYGPRATFAGGRRFDPAAVEWVD